MTSTANQKLFSTFFLILSIFFINTKSENTQNGESKTLEKFTLSSFHLRELTKTEFWIVGFLETMSAHVTLNQEEQIITLIGRYLEDFAQSSGKVNGVEDEKIQIITGHPLLAFRMIFRFHVDLPQIWKLILERIGEDSLEVFLERANLDQWPQAEDVEEAMEALLRLCFIYDLELDKFASGNIQGIPTGFGVSERHAMEIGKYALERYPALAVEWLELAKSLILETDAKNLNADELDGLILKAVTSHDKLFDSTYDYSNIFFVRKIVPRKNIPYEYDGFVQRTKQRTRDGDTWGGRREMQYSEANFWGLCSGRTDYQTVEEKSKLRCWYESRKNAAWRINPLKIEELSSEPHIIQIYNVIGNEAADSLKEIVEPTLNPSRVIEKDGTQSRSSSRTSFGNWLPEGENPESAKIARLVELITGLHVVPQNSSESLQIASYTFGGHYNFHVDAVEEDDAAFTKGHGNRIATFMIYLSNVEAGGLTAFVNARVAAQPVKGSAVFWYNLDTAGIVNKLTQHGACPLLLGGPKWVANKWIRQSDQFNVRKCPSDYHTESGLKENRY